MYFVLEAYLVYLESARHLAVYLEIQASLASPENPETLENLANPVILENLVYPESHLALLAVFLCFQVHQVVFPEIRREINPEN
ncbi:hypothetical protein MKX96_00670 [Psychrobacillus sp. FSL W7-1493]|uniref:hypothetical protein n=1 Tax=unclassified Psychrobacillus TaxID=2636677 RepID=UPI0030F7670D